MPIETSLWVSHWSATRRPLALAVCGLLAVLVADWAQAESLPSDAQAPLLKGEWAQVLAVLESADAKAPDVVFRLVAAHACLACNRNTEALLLFLGVEESDAAAWRLWTEALLRGNPDNAVAHHLHADALARCGEVAAAEEGFTRALERDAKLGLAWVGRGDLRAITGRTDEAYLDLMRATQVQPTLAEAWASLGCLEVMNRNAEGALDAFNKALQLDPSFALAYNGRGCARYGLGKPDEAAMDFEMAETLCPVLVIAEANHAHVLALVCRQVDKMMGPADKPGTTMETKVGPLSSASGFVDEGKLQSMSETEGPLARYRYLGQQRQGLLDQISTLNQWMQNAYMPGVCALNGSMMALETSKAAWTAIKVGLAGATGGLPGAAGAAVWAFGKDRAGKAMDQTTLDRTARATMGTLLAGMDSDFGLDSFAAVLQTGKELVGVQSALWDQRGSRTLQAVVAMGLGVRQIEQRQQALFNEDLLRRPEIFAPPKSGQDLVHNLTGLTFASDQKWLQMPNLLNDVMGRTQTGAPVLLVGQDAVRASAFGRMLDVRGIPNLTVAPTSLEQLQRAAWSRSPLVVGFRRDLDDSWSKMGDPPNWPDDHGGGGGAATGSHVPITIQQNTFSFPGTGGQKVTLPLPRSFTVPTQRWDSFRPWTPPPTPTGPGGVDTKQLEWVFVDKGNWPVVTFFTLAYEASGATQGGR